MRNRILVVDDEELNREILSDILKDTYDIDVATNGMDAINKIQSLKYMALLLDLNMPDSDGYEVLEYMSDKGIIQQVPVIVITEESSVQVEERCLDIGAYDFIHKPFNRTIIKKRLGNVVELFTNRQELEKKVKAQTATLQNQYKLLSAQAENLKKINSKITDVLGTVVEYRNMESGEHISRVKKFTQILSNHAMKEYPEYGLTPEIVGMIVDASPLHDVGKIAIPDTILLKPGKLTNDEFDYMKSHTTRGCDIIDTLKKEWGYEYYKVCYDICRSHHEKYDGRGYPDGLKGEEIPISAQLVSIADVYDALVHERVYKAAISKEKAFNMIITGECGMFSPKLLECLRNAREEFESVK